MLAALAEALRLRDDDLDHLRRLALISHGTELCPQARAAARAVRPTVVAMLGQLEPAPAFVINHMSDLLAWTDGYDRLARPLGILDGDEPNLLRFTFTDERARAAFPDWDDVADEQVANLRAELREPGGGARILADRLACSSGVNFTDRGGRGAVTRKHTGVKELAHPEVGLLRVRYETLELPDPDRQRLVVYLPADAATSAGLDRLAGRGPGGLRSVTTG